MTDDLAESRGHIRALLDILCRGGNGDPLSVGKAQNYLDRLDAEGQTVEGGGLYGLMNRTTALWKAKFPKAGLNDHLRKLSGEVREPVDAPDDPDEWADVLLCYLMSACAKGFTALDLIEMAALKMSVCEAQEFVPVGDGTYRRIKTDIRSLIDQTGGEGGI